MRNAIRVDRHLIITTDNSGGIGEKAQDVVQAPDSLTAYFAARVTLLEQWAANADVMAVMIHNFSGEQSWTAYVQGVEQILTEAGLNNVSITGSTETNMNLLQSAMSVTMIGCEQQTDLKSNASQWFTYGEPLVGEEVLRYPEKVASLEKIKHALDNGKLAQVWPTGSKGIAYEMRRIKSENRSIQSPLDTDRSCGPSTVVLLKIDNEHIEEMQQFFGPLLQPIHTR